MSDLSDDIGLDESYRLSPKDVINDQSDSIYNDSINRSSDSFNTDFSISDETMRLLFLAIASITVLICLTICISVCICICLNRRRNLKYQEKQDHCLLPEQSERISKRNSLPQNFNSNCKQSSDKKISSSSIQQSSSNIILGKIPIRPSYYDNIDDIPFIDESRPTSYIDVTRV